MNRYRATWLVAALISVAALLAGGAYFMGDQVTYASLLAFINSDLSSPVFMVFMLFLPMIGFPISVFLIIAGIKFGILHAVLLWLFILPLHALSGYIAAKYLRPVLKRLLNYTLGYEIPVISAKHEAIYSFLFLAVPAIPYAAKNYLLPLAGVSLRYCVAMNCLVQSLLGLPFIILGKSGAEMDPTLLYIAIAAFVLLFLTMRWLKKRYPG